MVLTGVVAVEQAVGYHRVAVADLDADAVALRSMVVPGLEVGREELGVEVPGLAVVAGQREQALRAGEPLVAEQGSAQVQADVVPPGDDEAHQVGVDSARPGVRPVHPRVTDVLLSSQMVGLAMTRYVWKVGAIAQMSSEDVVRYVAPTIQRYLSGKLGS
jgi:Tetracyclin repressor-like, C-terminal domain